MPIAFWFIVTLHYITFIMSLLRFLEHFISLGLYLVATERSAFRLVHHSSNEFKNCDFECDLPTAKEIVTKINNILEMRLSSVRRDYLRYKQTNKLSQRHTFLLWPPPPRVFLSIILVCPLCRSSFWTGILFEHQPQRDFLYHVLANVSLA